MRTGEERGGGGAYLQQPIASTVEGRDDGGVDVAAIQTLERGEDRRRRGRGQTIRGRRRVEERSGQVSSR